MSALRWFLRVLAAAVVAWFIGMQVWAGFIWAEEGAPPVTAYLAELVMLAAVAAVVVVWRMVEEEL